MTESVVKPAPPALPEFSDSPSQSRYDAVVVGSGPNGFAAAITVAEAGHSVLLVEGAESLGGGMRSAELTRPGFVHDVCSAVHPLAVASPFFRRLPLSEHGLSWSHPDVPLAHPLSDGRAALLERSLDETVTGLGPDGGAYRSLFEGLSKHADSLLEEVLAPLHWPRRPLLLARFGRLARLSAMRLARERFGELGAALFAGNAAHSILPLENRLTAAVGMLLSISGHHVGWPVATGGSGSIARALASYFLALGGEVVVGRPIRHLEELPRSRTVLLDVGPSALARIASSVLPVPYLRRLQRYRYGPGAFKVDWALSDPIPWSASECSRAGTVHVGGTLEEVAASERACWQGRFCDRPFVLVAQQSLFDASRAPAEQHTGWGYCHVPAGSTEDYLPAIEAQMERFAPGFRDCILDRHVTRPVDFEALNPNYVGGDIIGGVQDARQLFARPVRVFRPYSTPASGIFICSSSTPPGAGVHGMCGAFAARHALRHIRRTRHRKLR